MMTNRIRLKQGTILFLSSWFFSSVAKAAGLEKAKTTLETFKSELMSITPVIAIIGLILLGIAYATNFVEKDTFFRWGVGILIVGSAAQITSMLLS